MGCAGTDGHDQSALSPAIDPFTSASNSVHDLVSPRPRSPRCSSAPVRNVPSGVRGPWAVFLRGQFHRRTRSNHGAPPCVVTSQEYLKYSPSSLLTGACAQVLSVSNMSARRRGPQSERDGP